MKAASLCSGIGGAELALSSLGCDLAWHAEIDADACAVHETHWPDVRNIGDITTADWTQVEPVDVLAAGYPCFIAGTLVATTRGDIPIENIRIGDLVLTHTGQWQPCTATMTKPDAATVTIRVGGAPDISCTPEHPFYARQRRHSGGRRTFTAPEWVAASELTPDHFIAFPKDRPDVRDGAYLGDDLAYLVGRYLGDGWIQDAERADRARGQRQGKVLICSSAAEGDEVAAAIERAGYHAYRDESRTGPRFVITNRALADMLHAFGSKAHGKQIPWWVHDLPVADKRAMLNGWSDADGYCPAAGHHRVVTVSRSLAVGMAQVARSVYGTAAGVEFHDVPPTTVIEGRTVNQRPWYRVNWRATPARTVSFTECGHVWMPVRRVTPNEESATVFNIAVADDESYTADGAVVHNCQPFSLAGSRKGTDDDRHLWPAVRRAVADLRPGWVLLENVRGHLSLGFDGVLGDLAALGFDAAWGVLGSHTVGGCHRRDRLWVVARDVTRVAEWPPTSLAANSQSGRVQGAELLPTPTAADGDRRSAGYARGNPTLYGALLPTPTARDYKGANQRGDDSCLYGALLPTPTAWLGRRPSQAVGDPERWANPGRSRELSDCVAGENLTGGNFGRYTAAVERWEAIHGAAPDPLTVGPRGGTTLNAAFPEWMMGYPAGWASSVVTNTAALRCVGNAIQPQTAAVAWSHLVARLVRQAAA